MEKFEIYLTPKRKRAEWRGGKNAENQKLSKMTQITKRNV
jgi:hypothetical protein